MADVTRWSDEVPLHDRDLLLRLRLYFDALDQRLRTGEGWLIFNAEEARSRRISGYVKQRLTESTPSRSYSIVSWRDFALSAYVQQLNIGGTTLDVDTVRQRRERDVASHVTRATLDALTGSEFLVVTGLKPAHMHEAVFLDWTIERRYQQRLATMLVTPDLPQELEADLATLDPTRRFWQRLFERMYETSLVAL
ncbi:MAG: hypothetical protein H0W06_00400 [Chloroflexia bacterium]|nr:hypothetical protein [Chloroflexia bacterium]